MDQISRPCEHIPGVCKICSMPTDGPCFIFCKTCAIFVNFIYVQNLQTNYRFGLSLNNNNRAWKNSDDKPVTSSFNLPPLPGANYKEEIPFIMQILKSRIPYYNISPMNYTTNLEKIIVAYKALISERPFRRNNKYLGENCVEKYLLIEFIRQITVDLKLIARFMNEFFTFRMLPIQIKWNFFKRFWCCFFMIDRSYDTMCTLGTDTTDRRLVLQDGKIVNIDTPDIDEVKKTTDRNCDDLIKLEKQITESFVIAVVNKIKILKVKEIEIAFLLGYLLWDRASN
ncbi:unnamed protein product [Dracunculus medinensis]|uniref:NR LBD domain-containing protein n=1 Tax=Dracunculus medinensis TaxID=318479 RepID=A0A0N4UFF2_DRAME|nr:unnamed protein product [Dracunculus medinensis]